MRKLIKDEVELTRKGIMRQEKVIDEAYTALKYLEAQSKFIRAQREFEDFKQPIDRVYKDKEIENMITAKEEEIKFAQHSIREMRKQLSQGVKKK